ncbi:type II toxin-antitoxin system prevent-host-death family antitoxin [Chelativorans salis]|uniref:Antitoxin n=1 Tax=Chelativorans salis TaxID=2978478 RepID=A0ABT2LUI2_9HYPH|nr:type II toxin-antitoxin system prevent-host-death family antitoxin [Chelativorans sp. EGI FJ00035]MCT7378174.1 type II toxin-antitoxin system prevent-host-death family antitoxin [Chelativorans sp. EGI FJ00035]
MKDADIQKAQADLSALIDTAEQGEPVVITRDGKAAAVLVPFDAAKEHYAWGNNIYAWGNNSSGQLGNGDHG